MNTKKLLLLVALAGVLLVAVLLVKNYSDGQFAGKQVPADPRSISSFAECVAEGYSIMESHPAKCRVTETNKIFTQIIHSGSVNSFKECVTAGYPVMQLNPRQCRVPGIEKVFEEVINAPITPIMPTTPIIPTTPPVVSENTCVIGGCSDQICQDASEEPAMTTCEFRPEYACYRSAKCERQTSGKCGWTETPILTSCLKNPPQLN